MNIRTAIEMDLPALATLFRETVLSNGPQHYSPAQVEAWAAVDAASPRFHQFILGVTTFVAENDTAILGFAGIGDDGYVASTYVRHDCLHRGIGSVLMQAVLTHAQEKQIQRLYAEASEFSLGLFQKFGFSQYDTEVVDRNGVQFTRYLVERV
ncbi:MULTISPECIES: GNAT family N-acetyltransferase [Cyanophyceae]|uniref:GNAT family N-acetyltransferase n=1 Tax=Cyanophyceae TaxID=3028117 RepID=UPI001687D656|nr:MULTISPECIES: GNAT family N-acetyltransferase [Cyanophyceae]MBD1915578.1 GNAT family N-acetyltransferase [Phormidium sp. FACHB-77]MBD2031888.1 GNAT family N-acetyltransferase [Phormidium sp. FACHB-322]MBD2050638.1 GNAT family N-acetyltransferase [Leptolyngbya sp. FACHB-60]